MVEQFKTELFQDQIYVLTPQGRVIDLDRGRDAGGFRLPLHTDLGHRCRGAKVNGAMVPLNNTLQNGQRVEIIAVKQGDPSRDWLNPALGYVLTRHPMRCCSPADQAGSHRGVRAQWGAIPLLLDVGEDTVEARVPASAPAPTTSGFPAWAPATC